MNTFLTLETSTIMAIVWAAFIVVSAIIELQTADLVTIWFTIGAIGALICALCKGPIWLQIVIFLAISIIAIILTRPIAKKMQQKEIIRTNSDKVIGRIAVVTKAISDEEIGEVKIEGREWRAINNEGLSFEVGEKVIVDAISGAKLIVSKIQEEQKEIVL
ncbi:MAG: NfeD family protein [Bacilli bacterium]|nr:NfeD family protein [Bacilli bacterium]